MAISGRPGRGVLTRSAVLPDQDPVPAGVPRSRTEHGIALIRKP